MKETSEKTTKDSAEELTPDEQEEAEERSAVRAHVVHAAILNEGQEELEQATVPLAFSGLAAGLSMGFSLVTQGILLTHLPDAGWRTLIVKLGYSVGFLIVMLGRQQLFTEKTLTAVLPLLEKPDRRTLANVGRLWLTVLIANIAGTVLFAWVLAGTDLFDTATKSSFSQLGKDTLGHPFSVMFLSAIFAGWMIALLVWLLPFADAGKVGVIIIITYIVGIAHFSHIIAGSVNVLYLVFSDQATMSDYLLRFLIPTFLGNCVGGVALVAALGRAQVVGGQRRSGA
ncbi:MAG: formate/nitrite transporter family protein [Acidobacteriota bacterium]